ncbi:MAG: lysine biosynthesis protein LysX [bacterium]|nr:lysine biosynthesis protein LysX [bacterium]
MRIGLIYTLLSKENKLLQKEAAEKGITLERMVDSDFDLEITKSKKQDYDLIYQRSVSYTRSLWATQYFENEGVQVINTLNSQRLCGDKALTTQLLAKQGVKTPRTCVAFSEEKALEAIETLGYPCVIKPVVGSWARMVHRINDRHSAEALIEARREMGNPWQKIYYVQEYVNKPSRDIRAFLVGDEVIGAIYRHSEHWITNTARGGSVANCPVTDELRETVLSAGKILDPGIYGVDLMECEDGSLTVHEINHSVEFRNSIEPTGVNIPGRILDFLVSYAKR